MSWLSADSLAKGSNYLQIAVITVLSQQDGLTRNEIVAQSGLSYEQVRRQTQNLLTEGKIRSCMVDGHRRYYVQVVLLLLVAFVPICQPTIENDSTSDLLYELADSRQLL